MYKLFMNNFSNALDKLAEVRMHVSLTPLVPIASHILIGSAKKKKKSWLHLCAFDGME